MTRFTNSLSQPAQPSRRVAPIFSLSAARGLSRTRARRPEDGQRKIGDRTRERGVKQEFEAGQSYRGAPGGAGTIWMMDANRAGFPSFFGLR